jgi:signal transduction histidine kinase
MPEGGTITLRVEPRDRAVLFAVSDTGPGIPASEQQIIFERYRRGAAASYEGLGLGLSISRGIVEAHGGRIWVESLVGKGATFSFVIPTVVTGQPMNASVSPRDTAQLGGVPQTHG